MKISAQENTKSMQTVIFTPKEFESINLGPDNTARNTLTPITDEYSQNIHLINVPERIKFENIDPEILITDRTFVFPICGEIYLTYKRCLFYDELSKPTLYLKRIGKEDYISGVYNEERSPNGMDAELLELFAKEREEEKIEVMKMNPEEIDLWDGELTQQGFNINLFKTIQIPIESGYYEVYISMYGLDSNSKKVEIIFEYEKQ